MKKLVLAALAIDAGLSVGAAWAGDPGRGIGGPSGTGDGPTARAKAADGGNGSSNGVPGCRGGTDPAPDGKFYVEGTNRECNPGHQDRKKVKSN